MHLSTVHDILHHTLRKSKHCVTTANNEEDDGHSCNIIKANLKLKAWIMDQMLLGVRGSDLFTISSHLYKHLLAQEMVVNPEVFKFQNCQQE